MIQTHPSNPSPASTMVSGPVVSGPVIVELDSSYESAEALRWAAELSALLGTRLEATRTWHPGLGEFRPDARDAVVRRLTTELGTWSALAEDARVRTTCRVVEGDWPSGFIRDAEHRRASLLVVPIPAGPSSSVSNSEAAAKALLQNGMTCGVALVPPSGAGRTIRRILVGTPKGVGPERLLDEVVTLAAACGAEVHVVSVLPLSPEWVPSSNPNSMWQLERLRRAQRWIPQFARRNVRHQFHVVEGSDPIESLGRFSRRVHADLIVVCSQWRGSIGSARRASSLVHLARNSGLAVISIPDRGEAADE
ncbi:MAG: hypothetical protein JWN39_2491 [Ilumatobacteraceae bacterium]|nr:hypothetical protein [Ilumatobacteraceae bacterium]